MLHIGSIDVFALSSVDIVVQETLIEVYYRITVMMTTTLQTVPHGKVFSFPFLEGLGFVFVFV